MNNFEKTWCAKTCNELKLKLGRELNEEEIGFLNWLAKRHRQNHSMNS